MDDETRLLERSPDAYRIYKFCQGLIMDDYEDSWNPALIQVCRFIDERFRR